MGGVWLLRRNMSGFCDLNRNMLGTSEKIRGLEYSESQRVGERQRLWALAYIFGCS
jgi:hypothetical protein